jgi:hypothetical protein
MSYPIPENMLNTMASPTVVTTPNATNVTYAASSGGGGGFVYTTSGTSSPFWNDTISISNITTPNTLQVNGNAEFDGDIKLKGKSLNDTLSKIEERLAILHPNEKLEEKWAKLRELRKQYQELETDILEKEKIVEILKR